MKLLITIIIALGVTVGFAMFALDDSGYLLIVYKPYTVKLPLVMFALTALFVFVALYLLFSVISKIINAPKNMREWSQRRGQSQAQIHTMQGYADLIVGEWTHAEKELLRKLQYNHSALLNHLGAAYAAQQQGSLPRRDQYLDEALQKYPQQQLAIVLTSARLHFQAGELTEAQGELETLKQMFPRNVSVVKLLADVYRELGDWKSLVRLMSTLAALKAYRREELASREKQAYERYLSSLTLTHDGNDDSAKLTETFQALPTDRKRHPGIIAVYVRQLLKFDEHALAEKTLRKAIDRKWDAELVYLYGKTETSFGDRQIQNAEAWIRKHGAQIDLTLTLARLYRRQGQVDKARKLFHQVIVDGKYEEEGRAGLGAVLEQMGDQDAALICYRQGILKHVLEPDIIDLTADDPSSPASAPGTFVVLDSEDEAGMENKDAAEMPVMPVIR